MKETIFEKTYHGFEDCVDVYRDVSEAFDGDFNDIWKKIPGEFQGKVKVTIEYEE